MRRHDLKTKRSSACLLALPPDVISSVVTMISAGDTLDLEATCTELRTNEGIEKAWPKLYAQLKTSFPMKNSVLFRDRARHILIDHGLKYTCVGIPSSVSFSTSQHTTIHSTKIKEKLRYPCRVLSAPQASLKIGDRGEGVMQLNQSLVALGFLPPVLTAKETSNEAIFTPLTRDAVVAFQFRHLHSLDHRMSDVLGTYGEQTAAVLACELTAVNEAVSSSDGGGGGGRGGSAVSAEVLDEGDRNNESHNTQQPSHARAKAKRDASILRLSWNEDMTQAIELSTGVRPSGGKLERPRGDGDTSADLPTARVVVLGGSQAGATSLIDSFLGRSFDPVRSARGRNDMRVVRSCVAFGRSSEIGIQVDITEKRFSARRTPFSWKLYAGSTASVLLCFDVHRRELLEHADRCLDEIHDHSAHSSLVSKQIPIFLVGCKADDDDDDDDDGESSRAARAQCAGGTAALAAEQTPDVHRKSSPTEREVSVEEACAFAAARGIPYVETSAKQHWLSHGRAGAANTPFLLAAHAVAAKNGWLPLCPETKARLGLQAGI